MASGNTPAPFGFTGELHSEGLVYLRARWYDPSSGVFMGRDPFAGFPETPYSLHPYQYAYSAPTMWTDASGKYPDYGKSAPGSSNWPLVRRLSKEIRKTAEHHARGLTGFTTKAFAAVMAAHITREHGSPAYNGAGDLAYHWFGKVPQSTGVGNLGFYYFDKAYDQQQDGWLTDLESCIGDLNDPYAVTDALIDNNEGTVDSNDLFSLDLLGMWIRQRIQEIAAKQQPGPTIFNVGQAIFSEGLVEPKFFWQGIVDGLHWVGFKSTSVDENRVLRGVRYVHGLAILQTVDRAAKELGYSGELTEADAKPYFTSNDITLDESFFVECQLRYSDMWITSPIPGTTKKCGPLLMDKRLFLKHYEDILKDEDLNLELDALDGLPDLPPEIYDQYR